MLLQPYYKKREAILFEEPLVLLVLSIAYTY